VVDFRRNYSNRGRVDLNMGDFNQNHSD